VKHRRSKRRKFLLRHYFSRVLVVLVLGVVGTGSYLVLQGNLWSRFDGGDRSETETETEAGSADSNDSASVRIRVDKDFQEFLDTSSPQRLILSSTELIDGEGDELIDVQITDRIQNGAVVLEIQNPFAVGVSGQLDIEQPGQTLSRPFSIGEGATSTVTLAYSGDDLRSFLGRPGVTLSGSGLVTSSAGVVTVTPGQEVAIEAKIDLTIQIGG